MQDEVTNGTVDPAHYGPLGDMARHIASYCEGTARVHVYTAAFNALAKFEQSIRHQAERDTLARMEPVAWTDVFAERQRQIEREGYTPEHDDHHDRDNALARAAACYALAGTGGSGPFWVTHLQTPQQVWPYRWEWKPSDRRRNLVKAAALLLAEIERMDRALVAKATGDGLS